MVKRKLLSVVLYVHYLSLIISQAQLRSVELGHYSATAIRAPYVPVLFIFFNEVSDVNVVTQHLMRDSSLHKPSYL